MRNLYICFFCLLCFNSLAEEIDTLNIINYLETDTLTEIESEYWEQFMEENSFVLPIENDSLNGWHGMPYSLSYTHTIIPFMNTSVQHNDSSILVIVDSTLYAYMPQYILRYATDIYYGTEYDVYIEKVSNASSVQVKELILSYQNKLVGVVLIGDITSAKFEQKYKKPYFTQWPCDLYYMDLDGIWEDNKDTLNNNISNDIYEEHSGNVKPEIFVGRISTYGLRGDLSTKYKALKKFFNKDHNYWQGLLSASNHKALTYIEKDWKWSFDKMYGIKHLFGYNNYNMRRYGDDNFGKAQYIQMIQSNQYDFIQLCAHSSYRKHFFATFIDTLNIYGDTISSIEIFNANTYPIGFNLFCCYACFRTNSGIYPDLGDSYIFNNGNTLFVVGSTKSGGMLSTKNFYKPLGNGEYVGNAFKQWFIKTPGNKHDAYDISWFYGMCILGDPLVSFSYDATDFCPDVMTITAMYNSNSLNTVTYKASQKIIVQEDYIIPNGKHVIFDAPKIEFAPNFDCTSGGTFETRDSGCTCSRGGSLTSNRMPAFRDYKEKPIIDESIFKFSIAPNPARDYISIFTSEELSTLTIYSLSGQPVLQTTKKEIDVSSLPSGMYIVRAITVDGELLQAKFIKQ